jgi:gluconolactonase
MDMRGYDRRTVIAGAGLGVLLPGAALAMQRAKPAEQASVISIPPRQWGPDAPPVMFPDPDVLTVDPAFDELRVTLAQVKRLATGFQWAEGPAWTAAGKYLVFSDVHADVQYRLLWETQAVSPFRRPSLNSNGNTFDFEGRQISGQDFARRVVRWEHDGAMTVIADSFEGRPLNSPNDFACHPDGSIWFTDPYYGGQLSEGHPDSGDGPFNAGGLRDNSVGNPSYGLIGGVHQSLPPAIYRWDPSGRLDRVATGRIPNGLAFSPDYKRLYFVWDKQIWMGDVAGGKLSGLRLFTDCLVDGVNCGPDGHRVDRAGNVWSGSNAPFGYSGVTVWNPAGKLIGRIRLPEVCANVCFGGPKRDWLLMAASQSIYALHVNIQGAGPG